MKTNQLTDAQLDNAFYSATRARRLLDAQRYTSEIIDRLTSFSGVLFAFASSRNRFPLYTRVTNFNTVTESNASLVKSARNLSKGAQSVATGIASPLWTVAKPLIAFAVVGGLFYVTFKYETYQRRKRNE